MKIVFKAIDESVNLSKVFPVISEQNYKLIEGSELIISDAEYKKIQKEGFLKIGPYDISAELIEIAQGQSYDPIQQKIATEIEKTCLYSESMVDILVRAARLKKNVIMFGRGGHNKSEGTMKILAEMKKEGLITTEPFVQAFGDGLTEEGLFGGINIKKFKDTGELEYLFKNSFMEHEIVVFEEIFDAPPQVLLSLKDILTSGYCRKGNQVFKSKTKVIIGLTNKSKEDFSEDDSLEALAQRFALTLKVEWDSYDKKDWRALFTKVYPEAFRNKNSYKLEELAEILTNNNMAKQTFVSPRTAIHAADVYCDGGDLKHISDIDQTILADFYKANKDRELENADKAMFDMVEKYVKENSLCEVDANSIALALLMKEHKARTGQDVQVDVNKDSISEKIVRLEYVVALLNMHNWNRTNIDKAKEKISTYKNSIVELKKQL